MEVGPSGLGKFCLKATWGVNHVDYKIECFRAFAFPGFAALLLVLILPFCPESPKFTLMTLGKRDEAMHAINRLVNARDAEPMFRSLVKEAAQFARVRMKKATVAQCTLIDISRRRRELTKNYSLVKI